MKKFFIIASMQMLFTVSVYSQTMQEQKDQYLQLVNEHRIELGLRPLIASPIIEEIATKHSSMMARNKREFGHTGWRQRCKAIKAGFGRGNRCGEIVAMGQPTTKRVFKAWLNSPDHRACMEGRKFTHTGLGFSRNANGKVFWTQLFIAVN